MEEGLTNRVMLEVGVGVGEPLRVDVLEVDAEAPSVILAVGV